MSLQLKLPRIDWTILANISRGDWRWALKILMGEKPVKTWLEAIPTGNYFFHQAARAHSC
jgi:hypothetical protein